MTEDDPASTKSTSPSDESPPQSSILKNAISRVVPDNPKRVLRYLLIHGTGMLLAMAFIGLIVYILRHSVPTDTETIGYIYSSVMFLAGGYTYLRHWQDYIHETPTLQSWTGALDALLRASLDALLFYSLLILATLVGVFLSLQEPPYSTKFGVGVQMWVIFQSITLVPLTVFVVKSFKSMRAQAVNTARQLYLDKPE